MEIQVKVYTKSARSRVVKAKDGKIMAYVKSRAQNNLANLELIQVISKYFNKDENEVKIIKGQKSTNKILEIK
mgnify:CR=1 FL=1